MSYYAQKVTFILHIQPAKVNISRFTRSAICTSTSCQSNSCVPVHIQLCENSTNSTTMLPKRLYWKKEKVYTVHIWDFNTTAKKQCALPSHCSLILQNAYIRSIQSQNVQKQFRDMYLLGIVAPQSSNTSLSWPLARCCFLDLSVTSLIETVSLKISGLAYIPL